MPVLAVATSLGNLVPAVTFEHLDEFSELHRAGRYLSGARWPHWSAPVDKPVVDSNQVTARWDCGEAGSFSAREIVGGVLRPLLGTLRARQRANGCRQ